MTKVADGNSIRMSATQEIPSLDRPEGFGLARLSPCSNTTLESVVKSPARKAEEADTVIGSEIDTKVDHKPEEPVAAGEEGLVLLEKTEIIVSTEVVVSTEVITSSEKSLGLNVQNNKEYDGEENVEGTAKAAPLEVNDVGETHSASGDGSAEKLVAVEAERPEHTEDLKYEEKIEGKDSMRQESPSDTGLDDTQIAGAGVTMDEVSTEPGTLDGGQQSPEVAEGTIVGGQHINDESEFVQKEETKREEVGSATNADKSSTNEVVRDLADDMTDRIANEMADKLTDDMADDMADEVADRLREEMAEKMTDEMADDMADRMADEMADRMADEMVDRMADEMADRMADEMADKMAAEMADELADEMADEVIEGQYETGEEGQGTESMEDGETNEVGEMEEEEEEMEEDGLNIIDDNGEGTVEEQMAFVEELERFFNQRKLEYKAPKFYGLELNVLKLWRVVTRLGGYEHVTVSKLWRTVGEEFKPPKTCTTISWSFRGFYEKALLDYERFKTGVPAPGSSQRAGQIDGNYLGNDSQRTVSPATPSSQANMGGVSGSGRARRDAAARAMQGWHSQRMGNGDAKESNSKEKSTGGKHVKKERKLTNIGGNGLKRKGTTTVLERAVKAVRAKGRPRLYEESPPSNSAVVNTGKRSIKQQDSMRRPVKVAKVDEPVGGFDPPIVDEGPKADWVKINVHKHLDCFEIYALVPGLAREEVRIQCEPGGRLVIAGMPEDPDNPWGVTPFRKVISLPSRIDAHQTSAVVTLYGQLYVRVPIAEDKSS